MSLIARIVWLTGLWQALVARHGHARRIDPALQRRLWRFLRDAGERVAAILARIEAGTLRRYPNRRPPAPPARPRRAPTPSPLPRGRGWMQRLIPELAEGAGHFGFLTQEPAMARLIAETPQLRRALTPLATGFDIRLPQPHRPEPQPTPPAEQPIASGAAAPPGPSAKPMSHPPPESPPDEPTPSWLTTLWWLRPPLPPPDPAGEAPA